MSHKDETSDMKINVSSSELTDKDIEFLMETLQEYVKELRIETNSIYKYQIQSYMLFGIVIGALLGLATYIFQKLQGGSNQVSIASNFYILFPILALVTTGAATTVSIFHRVYSARTDVKRLVVILDRLIRRASQIRDRGKVSFAQKVIMDVRLADAEAALNRAQSGNLVAKREFERLYTKKFEEDSFKNKI